MTKASEKFKSEHGGMDVTRSSRQTFVPTYNLPYQVNVTSNVVEVSNRGDVQLVITGDFVASDESEPAASGRKVWLTLPFQESDSELEEEATVTKLTLRRRDDLGKVMANAIPNQYKLYASKEGKKYIGFDGAVMDKDALAAREIEINNNIVNLADELHENVGTSVAELNGTSFWVVYVENKKSPEYPYQNYYSAKPEKRGNK